MAELGSDGLSTPLHHDKALAHIKVLCQHILLRGTATSPETPKKTGMGLSLLNPGVRELKELHPLASRLCAAYKEELLPLAITRH